jgi:hypothetical protein
MECRQYTLASSKYDEGVQLAAASKQDLLLSDWDAAANRLREAGEVAALTSDLGLQRRVLLARARVENGQINRTAKRMTPVAAMVMSSAGRQAGGEFARTSKGHQVPQLVQDWLTQQSLPSASCWQCQVMLGHWPLEWMFGDAGLANLGGWKVPIVGALSERAAAANHLRWLGGTPQSEHAPLNAWGEHNLGEMAEMLAQDCGERPLRLRLIGNSEVEQEFDRKEAAIDWLRRRLEDTRHRDEIVALYAAKLGEDEPAMGELGALLTRAESETAEQSVHRHGADGAASPAVKLVAQHSLGAGTPAARSASGLMCLLAGMQFCGLCSLRYGCGIQT